MPASYAQIVQACSKWNKFSLSFCCMQNYCTLTLTEKPNFPPQGVPESFKVWIEPAWVLTMSCLSGKVCWLRNMAKSKKENEAVGGGVFIYREQKFQVSQCRCCCLLGDQEGEESWLSKLATPPSFCTLFLFLFLFPSHSVPGKEEEEGNKYINLWSSSHLEFLKSPFSLGIWLYESPK